MAQVVNHGRLHAARAAHYSPAARIHLLARLQHYDLSACSALAHPHTHTHIEHQHVATQVIQHPLMLHNMLHPSTQSHSQPA